MGALPWTLRTSGNTAKPETPKVISSESSPLPKSVKIVEETRRGSLDDIHKQTNDDQSAITTTTTTTIITSLAQPDTNTN